MPPLSIIFDLDGTLLDTLRDLAETCNEVLLYHHFPTHLTEKYKAFVGGGLHMLVREITPINTKEKVIQQCADLFTKLYAERWMRNSCPYDGINDMLAALQKSGVKLAILSNKPHKFTKLFVDKFFTQGQFSIVYGQRDGFPKKPEPTVALEIAAQFGTHPQDIFFVGDSGVDIQTGKAANMKTIGVSWGFRSVQELTENNPDMIVYNPLELQKYVLSST